MECVFCKIISKELPSNVILENEAVIAFSALHPAAPVHILVIPRKHRESLATIQEEDRDLLGGLQLLLRDLVVKLELGENYKVALNGRDHGHVGHLHYHLLGGWQGRKSSIDI